MRCLAGFLMCLALSAQAPPSRPKVLGVAHYSIFVGDLAKARTFYEDFLGYEVAFTLPKADGGVQMAFLKINDHQYLELVNQPNKGEGQLNHLGLYTDDIERMRQYLASRGVKVPDQVTQNRIGNKKVSVVDPDGHGVEIVEYLPDSWTGKDTGKHMPATRISDRMMHAGILVGNLEAATEFYGGILGCHETWRGNGATSTTLNWVNMRVPDGDNHVEFMLYRELPPPDRRGSAHHICLVVPDIQKAVATLEARRARTGYTRELKINVGADHKRQVGLFDPDGTRVEMMEADTIDGKPAPSSTLPPPRVAAPAVDRKDVEFARPGGKPLLLDLHIPDGSGPFPIAILIHGGGFDQGSRSTNVRPLFEPLANAGFAWFSIDYRLAPEAHFPDAMADVNSAIRWVKAHGAEFHLDLGRISIVGESAGGYLVNYAGTHETPETSVAAVVDFYGPVDYGKLALQRRDHPEQFNMATIERHAANGGGIHFFGAENLDAAGLTKLRAVSPIGGVHKGMPPFLCIHGTKDDQVSYEQSVDMCAAMHKAGAACELIAIEGGGHGMSGWKAPEMQHWKPEMVAWLQKTLKVQ